MTKETFEKISKLLKEEEEYKERTRLFKERYYTYKIEGYDFGHSSEYAVFGFNLTEEDMELLLNASENKLTKIKQENLVMKKILKIIYIIVKRLFFIGNMKSIYF